MARRKFAKSGLFTVATFDSHDLTIARRRQPAGFYCGAADHGGNPGRFLLLFQILRSTNPADGPVLLVEKARAMSDKSRLAQEQPLEVCPAVQAKTTPCESQGTTPARGVKRQLRIAEQAKAGVLMSRFLQSSAT